MAVLGIQPPSNGSGYTVPTEVGVTAFGILAGVGGAVGQILAGRRLSNVTSERIPLRRVLLGTGVGILGTVAGAFFLPTE